MTSQTYTKASIDALIAGITKTTLGLGNVDNTADADKPVSAAQQAAITAAIAAYVDGAPAALDTLNELAAALGNDANFATTVTTALADRPTATEVAATYVPLPASGDATGSVPTKQANGSIAYVVPSGGPSSGGATVPRRFDITVYGAKMDAIVVTDAVTTAGQATVTSTSRAFTSTDVGKTIAVMGAGPVAANANDGVWISSITSVASGVATLTSNATTSGTFRAVFGTPDDAAFAAAQTAASTANGIAFGLTGGTVYIPPGRTIATTPLPVKNYVSWAGAGRDLSWVHIIQDTPGNGGTSGVADWLTCSGRTETTPLIGADFTDFGIEAEAHIHTAGYATGLKPLNIYYVRRCSIRRMNVWRSPATAIPFDHSYEQVTIEHNLIVSPGRLAPSGIGPGGSGIGAGTKGVGATEPTLISGNVIIGAQSATVSSPGQNGIFTEAQSGANPELGTNGYRIVNNVVIGMYYGISDTGSTGTLIEGNTIIGCSRGIAVRKTTLSDAYPGQATSIIGNTIRGGVGPAATDGIGIQITAAAGGNVRRDLQTIVQSNQILDNQSWGIYVNNPSGSGVDFAGIQIVGNSVFRNGRSGIRINCAAGQKLQYLTVRGNQVASNGKAAVASDQAGILVTSGTVMIGGRIQDNDLWDLATTRTQTTNVTTTGATLTGTTVSGNTAEPALDTTAPSVPGSPTATGSTGQVALTWAASTDDTAVTGYHVYRSDAPTTVLGSPTGTSYSDTTVTAGTEYTYTVDAFDAAGNTSAKSAASNSASSTAGLPGAPTSPSASGGNEQASVSWTAPASTGGAPITDYTVQSSPDGGTTWSTFSHTASSTASQTVTGLTNGTAYVFRIAAVNSSGTGPWSATTAAVTPAAVTNFVADSFTGASSTLDAHVGETGATWTRNSASTTTSMRVNGGVAFHETTGSATVTFYTASGVPASTDYTVEADLKVATVISGESSGITARASATALTDYEFRYSHSAGNWALVRRVAGTATVLGSAAVTLNVGQTYHLKLVVAGTNSTTITGYVDGVQVLTATDTTSPITAAGLVGLVTGGTTSGTASTGLQLDNFAAHA